MREPVAGVCVSVVVVMVVDLDGDGDVEVDATFDAVPDQRWPEAAAVLSFQRLDGPGCRSTSHLSANTGANLAVAVAVEVHDDDDDNVEVYATARASS